MRIIFLDIDGVLNCQLFYQSRTDLTLEICPERLSWLNSLCEVIDAKVVISSTWRFSMDSLLEQFQKAGGHTFEIVGVTPALDSTHVRGNEIALWIEKNQELVGRDYRNYVIIDDDSDMLYSQRNHLFLTDFYSGLTPNTCYRIKRFFSCPTT